MLLEPAAAAAGDTNGMCGLQEFPLEHLAMAAIGLYLIRP